MKKKSFILCILIIVTLFFSACQPTQKPLVSSRIQSMNTDIALSFESREILETHFGEIKSIYDVYDEVTNNYKGLENGSKYKHNLKTINDMIVGVKESMSIEVDKVLYEILYDANEKMKETDGYFNYTIGYIIDVWKNLLDDNVKVLSREKVSEARKKVSEIEIVSDPISFSHENGKYVITIKPGVKLDLGAYAKGYALDKVKTYLKEQQVTEYIISAGSSSILAGEKNKNHYRIGLTNPFYYIGAPEGSLESHAFYGYYNIKNESITTSGSKEQFVLDEDGNRYHHIISPITKEPINIYHLFSIFGENAGDLDAYSTAIFSMTPKQAKTFLESKKLSGVSFNYDNTYSFYGNRDNFEIKSTYPIKEKDVM